MRQMIPTIARHWPFANGSGRILDMFADPIDLGSGERTSMTSDGFAMTVFADDLIGRHILMSGKFDRSIVQVLLDQARSGDMLVDIGANVGYVTACFLANIPNSRAICFEPQPGVVDLLIKNLAQFGNRAEIHQVALSDKEGELSFDIDERNRGASRINQNGSTKVPAIEAGAFFRSLERVDLVKIDIEGHEVPVLLSIESELKRLRPRAVLFEDQTRSTSPTGTIGGAFRRAGYEIFGIEKRLLRTALRPVRDEDDCRHNDYLAIAR